ncbi:MAG TPA: hypothetical protein VFL31_05635 [Nitrospiraceae bacterium]|nr:hypothetical protein [Nitrospiraceae bacterium]
MLSRRTVLVLGAGASRPYGFPTGKELIKLIHEGTRKPSRHLAEELIECGFQFDLIQEFGRDLKLSSLASIDAFLEHRKKFRDVGKAAIAAVLIPLEKETSFEEYNVQQENSPWYDYLIYSIGESLQEVARMVHACRGGAAIPYPPPTR